MGEASWVQRYSNVQQTDAFGQCKQFGERMDSIDSSSSVAALHQAPSYASSLSEGRESTLTGVHAGQQLQSSRSRREGPVAHGLPPLNLNGRDTRTLSRKGQRRGCRHCVTCLKIERYCHSLSTWYVCCRSCMFRAMERMDQLELRWRCKTFLNENDRSLMLQFYG